MTLREKMIPCQSREVLVTVFSYNNGRMEGYLQHPRLESRACVRSLAELFLILNSLLDMENCPNRPLPLIPVESNGDHMAVFRIQVLFREHHTWQGRLVWEDEKREAVFRSVLELIQLMDEILGE